MMSGRKIFAYVGSWTVQAKDSTKGGIGIYEYSEQTGSLRHIDTVRPDIVSGMMCVDQKRGVLYCVDEQTHSAAYGMQGGGGRVLAFSIHPDTGELTQINEQPAFGTLTAYVEQDGTGDWLVAVNHSDKQVITKYRQAEDGSYLVETDYSTVTAVLYPLAPNGAILPAQDVIFFPTDKSVIPARRACLHTVRFAPDGTHCFITNMKQDEIMLYRLDRERGKLVLCSRLDAPAKSFPRYAEFHPKKNLIYVNYEHADILHVFSYGEDGALKLIQEVDTTPHPKHDPGKKVIQTDLKISRDGKYLYDFYRGANCGLVFRVDGQTGLLERIQELPLGSGADSPRGCAIDPNGAFLVVANNLSNTLTTLRIQEDGTLSLKERLEGGMEFPGNVLFYCAENS